MAQFIDFGLGLMAIAIRHRRYRAEVLKLLRRDVSTDPQYTYTKEYIKILDAYKQLMLATMEEVDVLPEAFLDLVERVCKKMPQISRLFTGLDKIPKEHQIAFYVKIENDFMTGYEGFLRMIQTLTWVAKAEAEELYIPEKYQDCTSIPFDLNNGMMIAKAAYENDLVPFPQVYSKKKPSRNAPCSCGSKKKYKRCCYKRTAACQ